jgi:hypothetical protein
VVSIPEEYTGFAFEWELVLIAMLNYQIGEEQECSKKTRSVSL